MSQAIPNNIDPGVTSGDELADVLNAWKDAYASGNSGTSRPANLQAGGAWIDVTDAGSPNFKWVMKIWDGTADIAVFNLDIANHVVTLAGSSSNFDVTKISADAVGPILNLIKKRIASAGQVNSGDSLGAFQFNTTSDTGAVITSFRIKAVAAENTTDAAAGSYLVFEGIDPASASILEKMRLTSGNLGIGTSTPTHKVHAKGANSIAAEHEVDSTVGPKLTMRKKRVTSSGQVNSGDFLGTFTFNSTDNTGAEITGAVEVSITATQNHTTTAHGSKLEVKTKKTGATTQTTMASIGDIVDLPEGARAKNVVVGSNGTAATNGKIIRSGTGKISIVLGSDVTTEGSEPTTLGKAGFRFEDFVNASLPSAGNAGRIAWVSDLTSFKYDDGSGWNVFASPAYAYSAISSVTTLAFSANVNIYECDASGGSFNTTIPTAVGNAGKTFVIRVTAGSGDNYAALVMTSSQTVSGSSAVIRVHAGDILAITSDGSNYKISSAHLEYSVRAGSTTESAYGITVSTFGDITSLALSAGGWSLDAKFLSANTTVVTPHTMRGFIGTTSGNNTTGLLFSENASSADNPGTAFARYQMAVNNYRVKPTTATTYYWKTALEATGNVNCTYMLIATRTSFI